MFIESVFQITLVLATFFTSLVAGLLFTFAIVVMPGIKCLNDREFIRAFQVMDGVIQKNHPLFIIVWVGSVLTLIASAITGMWQLEGIARFTLLLVAIVYIAGVQLPTLAINVPLNNRLQTVDASSAEATLQTQARNEFETRWNFWNSFRAILASLVSVTLIILSY